MLKWIVTACGFLALVVLIYNLSIKEDAASNQIAAELEYSYNYDELYQFIHDSMSEVAFITSNTRDLFAAQFAEIVQNQAVTFQDMRNLYVFKRNSLSYIHDLLFKLGFLTDYYQDQYLEILLTNPEEFHSIILAKHPEFTVFFKLYLAVIRAKSLQEISNSQKTLMAKIKLSSLSPEQLVEYSKAMLMLDNQKHFFHAAKVLAENSEVQFLNQGFAIDSWHVLANFYYYQSRPKDALIYCNKLYDLFKQTELFYPITKQVDLFSEVMPFLTDITDKDGVFIQIIDKIFKHPEYLSLTDPRLIALIYMNLTNASMQHLNQDYIFDLGLEFNSFLSDYPELSKNYFIQEAKFNIFNILVGQADYYNLAMMLDEIEFSEILGNKNPLYGRLLQIKIVSGLYDDAAEFDLDLVSKLQNYLKTAYIPGSRSYIQGWQLLISYYNKYQMFEVVIEQLSILEAIIMRSSDTEAQLEFLLFSYEIMRGIPEEYAVDAKAMIRNYQTKHYIENKKIREYFNTLLKS